MASDALKNPDWSDVLKILTDPTIQVGLAGPPGVGKTSAAFWAGKKMKKPVIKKVQFHQEMSPAEVLGILAPANDKTRFIPGPAAEAYSEGGMLILDEIDQASGPMKTCLYALLDRGPGGNIDWLGRRFKQEKGYQPVATMNGWPRDGSLPEPVLDRFDCWLIITRPSEEQLTLLDADLRELCRRSYEAAKDSMQGPDLTFRMFLGLQKLRKRVDIETAVLAACYGDKMLAHSLMEVLALQDEPEDGEDEDESEDDGDVGEDEAEDNDTDEDDDDW